MPDAAALSRTSLTVLYSLAQAMLDAEDEGVLLRQVVGAPVEVLGANRACLITFGADGEIGAFLAAGAGAEHVQRISRAELDSGLTGWVMRERRMAVSPAGRDDPRESEEVQRRRRETLCGHIVVLPLACRGQVLGTLTVITEVGAAPFSPDDLDWFEALANLAAVGLMQHRLHHQLAHLAHFDRLTELPNRALFHDRLGQALARTARYQTACAVLYLDLNGFKQINDSHGHDLGDQVLCTVAARLRAAVRQSDTVARLGGDEFVVVLGEVRDAPAALAVGEKLRAAVGQPMQLSGLTLTVSAAVGVGVAPVHARDAALLCKLADDAMYRAKRGEAPQVRLAQVEPG